MAPAITRSSDFSARASDDGGRDSRGEPTARRRTTSWNLVAAPVGPVSQSKGDATNPNAKRAAGFHRSGLTGFPSAREQRIGRERRRRFRRWRWFAGHRLWVRAAREFRRRQRTGKRPLGLTIPARSGRNRCIVERRVSSSERARRATALGAAGNGGRDSRATLAAGTEEPGRRGPMEGGTVGHGGQVEDQDARWLFGRRIRWPAVVAREGAAAGLGGPRGSRTRWRHPASRPRGV